MNDAATRACLALHRNSSLSSRNFYKLLNSLESPEQVFALSHADMDSLELPVKARLAISSLPGDSQKQIVEQDLAMLQAMDIKLAWAHSELYPEMLREIPDPPALLYVRGNSDLLKTSQLAMVGSRRCSPQGAENAFQLAGQLVEGGFTVTSGLALGIDAESHRGALEVGGNTIAVLGTGVDVIYPRRNAALYKRMLECRSALVSEFPLGAGPRPSHFPVRNRIISGMSLGVVVVEGAPQSGSLVTARCALEQGREVFAVPGSIHNPGCRGCHQLIRQGATLVETASHIIEELGGWIRDNREQVFSHDSLECEEAALLKLMGYDPVTINTLHRRSGKPVAELMSLLTVLELKGLVEVQGGCYQRLCSVR